MPVCLNCEQEVSATARFCPHCGDMIALAEVGSSAASTESGMLHHGPNASGATAAAAPARITRSESAAGVSENLAGMLAYFFLPAIVFLLVRPFNRNRFIRFHSMQCLLTAGVALVLQLVLFMVARFLPLLGLTIFGLLLLAEFMLWLLLLVKAWQGSTFKLPVIGELAEEWADRA